MKKKQTIEIRNKIWKEVWDKYKKQYPMDELAEILEIPLTTFFRGIKRSAKQ